jgi:hypothetical protein
VLWPADRAVRQSNSDDPAQASTTSDGAASSGEQPLPESSRHCRLRRNVSRRAPPTPGEERASRTLLLRPCRVSAIGRTCSPLPCGASDATNDVTVHIGGGARQVSRPEHDTAGEWEERP